MRFSNKKHIPLFLYDGSEFYPWQVPNLIKRLVTLAWKWRWVNRMGINLWPRLFLLDREWQFWETLYRPPQQIRKDCLLLDVGAGIGETLLFYIKRGFTKFRAVESDPACFPLLMKNVQVLRDRLGVEVEVRTSRFSVEDLGEVDFMKIDCEGCESLLFNSLPLSIPFAIETHGREMRTKLLEVYPKARLMHTWNEELPIMVWHVNYSESD